MTAPAPRDDTAIGPVPLVRIEGVSKSFGAVAALRDVSLDVGEGEFLCLLGPSGCGKSTLLRLLAGFESPERGTIRLDGRDIAGEPPHRRPFNMMFQSYALFPHLTVAANVVYGLRWTAMGRSEVSSRVAEMLRLVRLDGLGGRYPAQISGGQRQRVALARALARAPRLLLLDEPLGALDRRLREETRGELKRLQAETGATFVMVTHDQDEALGLADRIAVMEAGRLVQAGTPREVYERPRTRFVAGFLGEVNIIEGEVAGRDGGCALVATGLGPTPLAVAGLAALGTRIGLAVRPERIGLGLAADEVADANRFPGTILEAAYLGSTVTYRVAVAGATLRASEPNRGGPGLAPGREVWLSIPPDAPVPLA